MKRRWLFAIVIIFMALHTGGKGIGLSAPGQRALEIDATGDPLTESFLRKEILSLPDLAGAEEVRVPSLMIPPPNQKVTIPVQVLREGKKEEVEVRVRNYFLPRFPAQFLAFSDHPETVTSTGLLFSGGIILHNPIRFYYYHVNGMKEAKQLALRLYNPSHSSATLHVIRAEAKPGVHEMAVGHEATRNFLITLGKNLGRILTVHPGEVMTLPSFLLSPGELASGFVEFHLLKGKPLEFALEMTDPDMPGSHLKPQSPPPSFPFLQSSDPHARGVYAFPSTSLECAYLTGSPPLTLALGDLPVTNLFPGKPLKGSYGMYWEAIFHLKNQSHKESQISLYFQPRGGAATGTFLINGYVREVPLTRPYFSTLLVVASLRAGEERALKLESLSEGGSSYPARIAVGERQAGHEQIRFIKKDGEIYLSLKDLLREEILSGEWIPKGSIHQEDGTLSLSPPPPASASSTPPSAAPPLAAPPAAGSPRSPRSSGSSTSTASLGESAPPPSSGPSAPAVISQVFLEWKKGLTYPLRGVQARILTQPQDLTIEELMDRFILLATKRDPWLIESAAIIAEATSNENGYLVFPNLPPGRYILTAVYPHTSPPLLWWAPFMLQKGATMRLDLTRELLIKLEREKQP